MPSESCRARRICKFSNEETRSLRRRESSTVQHLSKTEGLDTPWRNLDSSPVQRLKKLESDVLEQQRKHTHSTSIDT